MKNYNLVIKVVLKERLFRWKIITKTRTLEDNVLSWYELIYILFLYNTTVI